jgi:hypothetical protein
VTNWPKRRTETPIEPPAWVRCHDPAQWPNLTAWTDACTVWFDAHPEADAAHWAWVLSIPDEPFNPYEDPA